MILFILLPALEKIINGALKCDPDALAKISKLKNQTIKIHISDWKITFFMLFDENGIQLHKNCPLKPDTEITSTLSNFLKLASKGADNIALFQHPIEVIGNTHNLEILRDAFRNLHIDWEDRLAPYLGDVISHQLFSYIDSSKNAAKNTLIKLSEQIKEYILFEAKYFPTKKQVEKFYTDIANLRNDMDRLQAKIALMEKLK